ncbi:hypothetical protein Tco_0626007 [Tanacetum coccineum]|uniref:Uncharacterized protein n=1 Tax=Tanacetum coccineum TaxID=301880 RepID=A0ABQ4WIE8_9ASTR
MEEVCQPEVKTAGDSVDDIAAESLVYIRRSAAKTKDKGKGIMEELNYLMTNYTLQQLRGYSFDEIKSLFEATMKKVNTFTPMESDVDRMFLDAALESTKEAIKKNLVNKVLRSKKVYQVFEDMLKTFDMDDLVKLWSLFQERFNLTKPIEDKEIEIWVELKRLFEPDADNELWKSQKHIHDITWRLYYDLHGSISWISKRMTVGYLMLVEREYPLLRGFVLHRCF